VVGWKSRAELAAERPLRIALQVRNGQDEQLLLGEDPPSSSAAAVRRAYDCRYKWIDFDDGTTEFYNLNVDPMEQTPLDQRVGQVLGSSAAPRYGGRSARRNVSETDRSRIRAASVLAMLFPTDRELPRRPPCRWHPRVSCLL
jgi:hypothetical protein